MSVTADELTGKALRWTFSLYLLGALYVTGPVLGWVLAVMLVIAWHEVRIHPLVWMWVASMLLMEVALVAAHIELELSVASVIKSSVGWAKGWALMALFIAAGALLRDPAVIYRGACHIGIVALVLSPLLFLAGMLGLPESLFISPLKIVGGSGVEFFEVTLYEMDPGFGIPRLRYFAPWPPAIGLVGNVLLLLALQDSDAKFRILGCTGCVVMIVLSLSRLGWIVAMFVPTCLCLLGNIKRPRTWLIAAPLVLALGLVMPTLLQAAEYVFENLMSARADSTLVRGWLAEIALQRWQTEAPLWGHGVVETGPHLVQFMPIGSHHTWLGLLFVKGIVGAIALAVPMFCTTLYLSLRAISSTQCRTALGIMLVLGLYTFGENLEVLVYLFWPGLLYVGSVISQEGMKI